MNTDTTVKPLYKVRDFAICVNNSISDLTEGNYYHICSIGRDSILVENDKGYREWYRIDRFKKPSDLLAENKKLKQTIAPLAEALQGMVEYWGNEIGGKIEILQTLPVNTHYRKAKEALSLIS